MFNWFVCLKPIIKNLFLSSWHMKQLSAGGSEIATPQKSYNNLELTHAARNDLSGNRS